MDGSGSTGGNMVRKEIIEYLDSIKKPPVIFNSKSVVHTVNSDRKCKRYNGELTAKRRACTQMLKANCIPGWDISRYSKKLFIARRV